MNDTSQAAKAAARKKQAEIEAVHKDLRVAKIAFHPEYVCAVEQLTVSRMCLPTSRSARAAEKKKKDLEELHHHQRKEAGQQEKS